MLDHKPTGVRDACSILWLVKFLTSHHQLATGAALHSGSWHGNGPHQLVTLERVISEYNQTFEIWKALNILTWICIPVFICKLWGNSSYHKLIAFERVYVTSLGAVLIIKLKQLNCNYDSFFWFEKLLLKFQWFSSFKSVKFYDFIIAAIRMLSVCNISLNSS